MNIFVRELTSGKTGRVLDKNAKKVKIEDNIGESIHIHLDFARLEMSVDDFKTFAQEVSNAADEVEDGNY